MYILPKDVAVFRVRTGKWIFLGIKKETGMPSTKLGASGLD